jgi:hypothetical protein
MPKKIILDIPDLLWKDVKREKLELDLPNLNEAVRKLIIKGLRR